MKTLKYPNSLFMGLFLFVLATIINSESVAQAPEIIEDCVIQEDFPVCGEWYDLEICYRSILNNGSIQVDINHALAYNQVTDEVYPMHFVQRWKDNVLIQNATIPSVATFIFWIYFDEYGNFLDFRFVNFKCIGQQQ